MLSVKSQSFCPGLNTLRPRQNGRRFADDTFKCILLNENVRISIKISLKFVPKGPINNNPALVQIMAWRWSGDKPLSEPMMVSLLTHTYVTRPQWVNVFKHSHSNNLWVDGIKMIAAETKRHYDVITWKIFPYVTGEFPAQRASNADSQRASNAEVSFMLVHISCKTNSQMTRDLRLHDVHVSSLWYGNDTQKCNATPFPWLTLIYDEGLLSLRKHIILIGPKHQPGQHNGIFQSKRELRRVSEIFKKE